MVWKEEVVSKFAVLFRHLPGETKKATKNIKEGGWWSGRVSNYSSLV
jgi:hypothetical protein